MRRILMWLGFLSMLLLNVGMVGAGDVAFHDEYLDVSFPKSLAGLTFVRRVVYEQPELGYSLRYDKGEACKADIYVYSLGLPAIPTGCQNDFVLSEAEAVRTSLEFMAISGACRSLHHFLRNIVTGEGGIKFLWDKYDFEHLQDDQIRTCFTECYITSLGNRFIKLRLTYRKSHAQDWQDKAGGALDALCTCLAEGRFPCQALLPENVLEAIHQFDQNPRSQKALEAMPKIMQYLVESPDVTVVLEDSVCPWMREKNCPQRPLLLVAYVAGNIEAQIEKKECKDHPYAGACQVLRTYHQLRENSDIAEIEVLEEWNSMKADGKLESFLDRVLNSEKDTQVAEADGRI